MYKSLEESRADLPTVLMNNAQHAHTLLYLPNTHGQGARVPRNKFHRAEGNVSPGAPQFSPHY